MKQNTFFRAMVTNVEHWPQFEIKNEHLLSDT